MLTTAEAKTKLLAFLRTHSVFHGDFTLSSGAKSSYYIDCRLTTLNPEGAWLVAEVMHDLIQSEAAALHVKIDAIGGLTLGADPIALAVGMYSCRREGSPRWNTFVVRKAPKGHGQARQIEGNFRSGDTVVVVDDVVTRGESTLTAIRAVESEGGKVAFAAVLVDRGESGREKIESQGYRLVSAFTREQLVQK